MDWEKVQLLQDPAGWEMLPENGWGAVMAAAAGVTTHSGRRVQRWTEPRSIGDQSDIDDAANEYLAAASLPARPAGFDWFIRKPTGFTTAAAYCDVVSARINETAASSPTEVLAEARRAVAAVDRLARSRT